MSAEKSIKPKNQELLEKFNETFCQNAERNGGGRTYVTSL